MLYLFLIIEIIRHFKSRDCFYGPVIFHTSPYVNQNEIECRARAKTMEGKFNST